MLQEMLASYPGTVLLVSHDRDFLDRTVTSVVAFEGDGQWIEYAGGYSDMVAQRGHGVVALRAGRALSKRASRGAAAKPAPAQRRRLSPTDQHVLKTAPKRIAALNDEIARLEPSAGRRGSLCARPRRVRGGERRPGKAQADLAAAEEAWLRVELLREEIEGERAPAPAAQ